jgi:hypothetical protein
MAFQIAFVNEVEQPTTCVAANRRSPDYTVIRSLMWGEYRHQFPRALKSKECGTAWWGHSVSVTSICRRVSSAGIDDLHSLSLGRKLLFLIGAPEVAFGNPGMINV